MSEVVNDFDYISLIQTAQLDKHASVSQANKLKLRKVK